LATREARAKAGQTQLDTAQAISEIIDKVQSMELEREKLIKKKLGTLEVDDYIEAQQPSEKDDQDAKT
jgi:hypothetical protein